MRRRTLVLGGIALAAAAACVVSWATRRTPVAISDDGSVEILGADYGTHIEYSATSEGWRRLLGRRSVAVDGPAPFLWVWYAAAGNVPERDVTVAGSCGCVFHLIGLAEQGRGGNDERVHWAQTFPRRSRELVLGFGNRTATVRFTNPAPAPPEASGDGVGDLPVSVHVGDETWVLAPDPDPDFVDVRAVDAGRSGLYWQIRGARFRDASGNAVQRASEAFAREHRLRLPLAGDPYHLCPHEPWWELELDVADGKTVTFRFPPPEGARAPR